MSWILALCISNVALAAGLAVPAWWAARRGDNPHLTRALWLLVLLKLIAPPVTGIPWPRPQPAAQPVSTIRVPALTVAEIADQQEPALPARAGDDPLPWPVAIGVIWLAGAVGLLTLTLSRVGRFHQLILQATPAPPALQQEAAWLAAELGLARAPEIRLVSARLSPLLWQWLGRSMILLPAELVRQLGAEDLRCILAHELVHLRRRDAWLRRLELAVVAVYWWLPLAWWARRELRAAEEQCCDNVVVARWPDRAGRYAATLWQTIDFLAPPLPLPGLASGFASGATLQRRFMMLTRFDVPLRLTRGGWIGLTALGLLILPAAAQQPGQPVYDASQLPSATPPPTFLPGEQRVEISSQARYDSSASQSQLPLARSQRSPLAISSSSAANDFANGRGQSRSPAAVLVDLSQLEGEALTKVVDDLEVQIQAKREALTRLNQEVRRLEQLLKALQTLDAGEPPAATGK